MTRLPKDFTVIAGAGGGGGKGGGGGSGSSGVNEAPNTLKSTQTASLLDVLSEGPILGLWPAPAGSTAGPLYSVAFDGTRVQNIDASYNFKVTDFQYRWGEPGQALIPGFPAAQAETNVSTQVKKAVPIVRTILNPDADRVRITMSTPSLNITAQDGSYVVGAGINFTIEIQSNGGGFEQVAAPRIEGKTTSKFQRAYVYDLPAGGAPWDIRITRTKPDSTSSLVQDDLYWDSYTTIIDAPLNYNMSAIIGWRIVASQFQSIPNRAYDMGGRLCQIPSNYDPVTRTYTGAWDGEFDVAWTNNPAWIMYDMVTHRRFGLGRRIPYTSVNKWALYSIGRFCDGLVPNGRGGMEPRFTCNINITEQLQAQAMLTSLASVFRGFTIWNGGELTFIGDMPQDPVGLYTNANVINGRFTYAGADLYAKHNQAVVQWRDQTQFGAGRFTIVEDQDDIALNGIMKTDVDAIACIHESEATRIGRWTLFTEIYESETVTFQVGLDGAFASPGDIVEIADRNKAGLRRGGRLMAGTTSTRLILDAPIEQPGTFSLQPAISAYADGVVQTRSIFFVSTDGLEVDVDPPFDVAPVPGSAYVVASGDLEPTLWRIMHVAQNDVGTYDISALQHRPDKWDYVENNIVLSDPIVSFFPSLNITNLDVIDYLVELSPISIAIRMLISWQSTAVMFDVEVTPDNGVTDRYRVETTSLELPAIEATYTIVVTPLTTEGIRGHSQTMTYTVLGKSALPADVTQFSVEVVQGVGLFHWLPVPDLDVRIGGHYEMRYSPSAGAGWNSASLLLVSIPGTASSAEAPFRSGTYLIKAVDSSGNYSRNPDVLSAATTTGDYLPYVRFCEDPAWGGDFDGTEIRMPQNWLVLGNTGGLFDEQLDDIDTWPDSDVLSGGDDGSVGGSGTYHFDNILDLGGVFTVSLSLDMQVLNLGNDSNDIDSRQDDSDVWPDFDDSGESVGGSVVAFISQTQDDPANPTATWSEWTRFIAGSYSARGFQFYVELSAPAGQNVAVETLCVIVDIRSKIDSASDVAWTTPTQRVTFALKFFLPPSVVVTIQNPVAGDFVEITAKDREGFDIVLRGTGGTPIAGDRLFDWHAAGY